MGAKKNLAIGVGTAVTAAAAAAGAYWLYGAKHSAQHRKIAKSWMLKARADVVDAVEKLGQVDREIYMKTVDEVMKRYANVKGSTSAELAKVAKELKKSWHHIGKHAVVKKAKKALKKARK